MIPKVNIGLGALNYWHTFFSRTRKLVGVDGEMDEAKYRAALEENL